MLVPSSLRRVMVGPGATASKGSPVHHGRALGQADDGVLGRGAGGAPAQAGLGAFGAMNTKHPYLGVHTLALLET